MSAAEKLLTPVRVQLSRRKGFVLQMESHAINGLDAVSVARPSRWGNPYTLAEFGRDEALRLFRGIVDGGWSPGLIARYDDTKANVIYAIRCAWVHRIGGSVGEWARCDLRGKNLACYCHLDAPCHADILLAVANR